MIAAGRGVLDCLCYYCRGQCGSLSLPNMFEADGGVDHPNFLANVAHVGGRCDGERCTWGDVCVAPAFVEPIPAGEHVCSGYVNYTTTTWAGSPSAPFEAGCGPRQWERHLISVWDVRADRLREELREHVEDAGRQALRRYVLYAPKSLDGAPPDSLLLLAPDTGNTPENMLDMASIHSRAEADRILVVGLEGVDHNQLNVGRDCKPQWTVDEDVPYALAVLREMHALYRIDPLRIACAGFSRGGRFCARLASELSPLIAAFGATGSLRYPEPNHAIRPVPAIAFHGSADPINPLHGGGHHYWQSSVDNARERWAEHNGCQELTGEEAFQGSCAKRTASSNCTDGADVQLYVFPGAGHTWPGSGYTYHRSSGAVAHCAHATDLALAFFEAHPLPVEYEAQARALLDKGSRFTLT